MPRMVCTQGISKFCFVRSYARCAYRWRFPSTQSLSHVWKEITVTCIGVPAVHLQACHVREQHMACPYCNQQGQSKHAYQHPAFVTHHLYSITTFCPELYSPHVTCDSRIHPKEWLSIRHLWRTSCFLHWLHHLLAGMV